MADTHCTDECPDSFHVHGHVTIPDNAIPLKDDAGNVVAWAMAPPADTPHTAATDPVTWGEGWTAVGYTTEGEAFRKPTP
jgi:hypothetical protein